jgi:TonB-linked SusC/RagA family outer membrane protein
MEKRLQVNAFVSFIMRVSFVQIVLFCGAMGLTYAHDGMGQQVLDKKVSIHSEQTNVRQILTLIEKKTGAKFLYVSKLIPRQKVTVDVVDESVAEVLSQILSPLGIRYEADGSHIILWREKKDRQVSTELMQVAGNHKGELVITGKVTDVADGNPLPGVNILVKGTTVGTTTDDEGNFTLSVPNESSVLIFSFIGFTTQEQPVGSQTFLDIKLSADINTLNEVVVVGYGEQKKASLTAAVSTFKGEAVASNPVANLSNNFAGRVAGVIVTQRGGEPGFDGSTINIRGIATNGNNSPLLVVDGIYRDFSKLDPNTIESYTVLKDAAAVAPYGLAGANGVILVTTKKGKKGAPSLTYNTYVGFQNPTRVTPFVNSVQYALMRNEAARNDGNPPVFSGEEIENYRKTVTGAADADPDLYPNSNGVQDILKRNATITYHNLELSGGSDNVRYYTSLGFTNQEGQWTVTNYKKYNLVAGIDADATKSTLISLKINGSVQNGVYPGTDATGLMYQAVRNPPTVVNYYSNGLWGQYLGRSLVGQAFHSGYDKTETTSILTNLAVEQKIPFVPGLSVKGQVSYDPSYNTAKSWSTPVPVYTLNTTTNPRTFDKGFQGASKPSLEQKYNHNKAFTYQAFLNYQHAFGNHDVTFLGVVESRNQKYNEMGTTIINYNSTIDELNAGSSTKTDYSISGTSSQQKQFGYVYRVSYSYANKYLAEVAGRYDGHYSFAPGRRYSFFPSYSIGWNIAEETFIKNSLSFFDVLKIRVAYGKSGNLPNAAAFQYLSSYQLYSGAYNFGNTPGQGLSETLQGNPSITWEKATKYNVGLEGSIRNGLISFELDFFSEQRTGMLMSQGNNVPAEYGVSLGHANVGKMDNRGFELVLGTRHTFDNGIAINVSGNVTYAKNKMVEILETDATYDNPNRRRTGRPFDTQFGYEAIGYFTYDDFNPDGTLRAGLPVQPWGAVQPGDIKYADLSGPDGTPDGVISAEDETVIGRPHTPQVMFGLAPTISFKGFDLDVLFQGAAANDLYINGNMAAPFDGASSATKLQFEDHWTPANLHATYPRLSTAPTSNNTQGSSWWIRDGRYIRLKSLQVGYTLPQGIVQYLKVVQSIRFYVAGQNLFTWTPKMKELIDPEASGGTINGQYYFQQKVVSFGATIRF